MKVTLIAHANLLFQSKETTLITDPILFGYLWEEINVHCPAIELDRDAIPKADILNISHRHQDHFDIRTLAYLATFEGFVTSETITLAPKDEILLDVLHELGLPNITPVSDFESIQIKGLTLTPTPSLNDQDYFPEHGLLVHDGEVTVWNQVDTIVSPEIVNYIKQLYPTVHLAHHRFLPLLEGNFSFHQSLNLPFEEYSSFLRVVKAVHPGFCVPGSAGFRYRDEFNFLNQYSFPTTQEQFLRDLEAFAPEVPSSTFFPGDVAEVTPGGVTLHRQKAGFVRIKENDEYRIEFKPVSEVPPIRTRTEDPETHKRELEAVQNFLKTDFVDALEASDMLKIWKDWQICYQLEVFGPEESHIWSLDFQKPTLELVPGRLTKINLYEGIACSELYQLIEGRANWDFVGISALYRYFHNIYRLGDGRFECFPQEKKFPAPLMQVFPAGVDMDRAKFMQDVRRWKAHYQKSDSPSNPV